VTLVGIILTVIGGLALLLSGWTISLNRMESGARSSDVTLNTSWLGLITLEKQEMSGLQAARVIKNNQNGASEDRTYRVELDTKSGIVPLTFWYSSEFGTKQETVNLINKFIKNHTLKSILIKEGSIPGLVFSGVTFFSGTAILIFLI